MPMPAARRDHLPFADRRDAGRRLALALADLHVEAPLVLALPRGGVPVAAEVARALEAPLDVMLVRKLGAPGMPEYGLGAIAGGAHPQTVLNDEVIALLSPDPGYVDAERRRQLAEIDRRQLAYLGDRPPLDRKGRNVILVDDGIATGATARAALTALRLEGAATIVLAVPVAPRRALEALRALADHVVCLATPAAFHAVGEHYRDFRQTTDNEVIRLLAETRAAPSG
jgi:putative phosphoribosyl transferase